MPKLIRDKIPELVEERGEDISVHLADEEEFVQALREKLVEEVGEFLQNPSPEEMADILEVMDAMCVLYDIDPVEVQDVKDYKFIERGGFEKKLILDN
jgi:predicted house-cleaning noncanonical NTP pyrophosphatase (MazG superfamily)